MKIESVQSAMERKIIRMKAKNKISNKEIRSITQSTVIEYTIKVIKFNYAGHMA